jgi:hypothetical protein
VSDDWFERDRAMRAVDYPYNLHLTAGSDGVVRLYEQRDGELHEQPITAEHGRGALGHGYVYECDDDRWGEFCNNGQCRKGLMHDRCTAQCSAEVVWDAIGCWTPTAQNIQPT